MDRTIIIYNYKNQPKTFTVPNIEIVSYYNVAIISGDEILTVYFKNLDNMLCFDSCNSDDPRLMEYYEGEYGVDVNRIDEWNSYPDVIKRLDLLSKDDIISYKRKKMFNAEVCRIR